MTNNDYEMIDGKPHLGQYFGAYYHITGDAFVGNKEENPTYQRVLSILNTYKFKKKFKDLEIRYETIIERPPSYSDILIKKGTLGIKFMVWGRAFKVKKLLTKKVKRYKKSIVNGKVRIRRIDKRGKNE